MVVDRKKIKVVDTTEDRTSAQNSVDVNSFAQLFHDMVPQLAQLVTDQVNTSYQHPTLETAPDFVGGKPAKSVIPAKEPTGSRRVPVKRLPAWNLEPDLHTFGPYFKAAGVVYTPQDISTLARAIPDVCLFPFHLFIYIYA